MFREIRWGHVTPVDPEGGGFGDVIRSIVLARRTQ